MKKTNVHEEDQHEKLAAPQQAPSSIAVTLTPLHHTHFFIVAFPATGAACMPSCAQTSVLPLLCQVASFVPQLPHMWSTFLVPSIAKGMQASGIAHMMQPSAAHPLSSC